MRWEAFCNPLTYRTCGHGSLHVALPVARSLTINPHPHCHDMHTSIHDRAAVDYEHGLQPFACVHCSYCYPAVLCMHVSLQHTHKVCCSQIHTIVLACTLKQCARTITVRLSRPCPCARQGRGARCPVHVTGFTALGNDDRVYTSWVALRWLVHGLKALTLECNSSVRRSGGDMEWLQPARA